MDIRELEPEYNRLLPLLPSLRKTMISRFKMKEDKLRCAAAGLLVKYVLGADEDRDILRDGNGKPKFRDGFKSRLGGYFSLTHGGSYAALSCREGEIGIDAEQIGSFPGSIFKICFRPDEQEWILKGGVNTRSYAVWTMKESIMKADGRGIAMEPKSFSVFDCGWNTAYREYDGHMFAAAAHGDEAAFSVKMVSPSKL